MTTLLRAGEAASEAATVTKALLRAGAELGLTRRELAKIVDVSEPQISRMGDGSKFLQAHRSTSGDPRYSLFEFTAASSQPLATRRAPHNGSMDTTPPSTQSRQT